MTYLFPVAQEWHPSLIDFHFPLILTGILILSESEISLDLHCCGTGYFNIRILLPKTFIKHTDKLLAS